MIALWGQWVYVSHLHACSVLKVKLANIKLLFINFETVTTDENNSIKKQFFQTVTVCVYINKAKIIDGKCNNPSQSQHDVACFTTIPNMQLMIPMTNGIHVCKHTKISLHICIHVLYTKSFGMCIEGKNLKGTLDLWTQHPCHDTIVCSIEERESAEKKGGEKSLIRIYRMPSWFPLGLAICKSSFQCAF